MNRIGDRRFLHGWQIIKAATQPDPECMAWTASGVAWRRFRHSTVTAEHAAILDVHHLEQGGAGGWRVMIVAESWWDDRHRLLRSQLWATHLAGDRRAVTRWIDATSGAGAL